MLSADGGGRDRLIAVADHGGGSRAPGYRALIENAGSIPVSATPQEFKAIIQQTLNDAEPTIREFGLQQDQ